MHDLCLCSIQRSGLPSTKRLYNSTSNAISQSDRLGRNMSSNCKIRRGFFQRLWSAEDPEGNNIRYAVYAYIPSNWRCHNKLCVITFICVLAYLFTLSTFVAFSYVFALLQLALWEFSAADTPRWRHIACKLVINCTIRYDPIRYDTIVVFKLDWKAEKLKQTAVPH